LPSDALHKLHDAEAGGVRRALRVFLAVAGAVLSYVSGTASAQRIPVTEVGAAAVATVARWDLAGVGVSVGYRPAAGGQSRLALLVVGGSLDGRAAMRAEATAQYLLNPAARTGVTLYAAAGAAFVGASRIRGAGYLTVFLGLEQGAVRRWGWFAEAGVGGGARLAAGVRSRRFSRR
jgi:hypothetical protein